MKSKAVAMPTFGTHSRRVPQVLVFAGFAIAARTIGHPSAVDATPHIDLVAGRKH